MESASSSSEKTLFGVEPWYFWSVFAVMAGFVFVNTYMWREVEPYYPEWGPQTFMITWVMFAVFSLRAVAYTGDISTAVTKAALPYLVVMLPFFTGFLNGSTEGPFPHSSPGVYVDTPPTPMFGFEEYCIYAGLVCLIAVRFIPYRDRGK